MVRWSGTAVLGAAVGFAEAADTHALAEVDVAGDAGGADVEPVGVLRGEFVAVGGFDSVDPACKVVSEMVLKEKRAGKKAVVQEDRHTGDLEFALTLQEGRVGFDELLSLWERMSVSTMSLLVERKSEHSHF